jgi:putative endonuclease
MTRFMSAAQQATTFRSESRNIMAGSYGGYTSTRRPVQLMWSEYFDRITDAIAMERRLKGWSRAKKEALIANDWKTIERLSKRRAGRSPTKSGPSP